MRLWYTTVNKVVVGVGVGGGGGKCVAGLPWGLRLWCNMVNRVEGVQVG